MNLRNGASSPRRRRLLAAITSAIAVLGALAVAGWLAHWPPGVFGGSARGVSTGQAAGSSGTPGNTGTAGASAPASAVTAVTGLASRNPATLRAALAVGFPVSPGEVAPAGTTIRVRPGTWQQRGEYATVRAVMTLPGRASRAETIYFVQEEGRWRVLFADSA